MLIVEGFWRSLGDYPWARAAIDHFSGQELVSKYFRVKILAILGNRQLWHKECYIVGALYYRFVFIMPFIREVNPAID